MCSKASVTEENNMGVEVGRRERELFAQGTFMFRVLGNRPAKKPGKVLFDLVFLNGVNTGKVMQRYFNLTIDERSALTAFLKVFGVNTNLGPGEKLNLDVINGLEFQADLGHYNGPTGVMNSLDNFVRLVGGNVPQNRVAPSVQPTQYAQPQYTPQPQYANTAPVQQPKAVLQPTAPAQQELPLGNGNRVPVSGAPTKRLEF